MARERTAASDGVDRFRGGDRQATASVSSRGTADATGLVERGGEVQRIGTAIDRAAAGEGSIVHVSGPAGIGKTGLLAVCMSQAAESGLRVLAARCRELERNFTYGVVRQLFDGPVLGASEEVRARLSSGPARLGLGMLSGAEPASVTVQADHDAAAVHGLYWLAANLAAERPATLVIDDAHWADRASLRFLDYLANRLEGLPLLVIVAARSDDPTAAATMLEELASRAPSALKLAALTRAGSAQVVRRRMGADAQFVAACHKASGGNPFLLNELLDTIEADAIPGDGDGAEAIRRLTPESVSRAVFLRLARLPAGTATLARAIAVLGDRVELSDAAGLAEITLERAAELSDALAVAGVLTPEPPLSFTHPVILEAVLSDLGPGERTTLHARAAELLHDRGGDPERIAAQLAASGPARQPWAVDILRRVARKASAQGAPDVAERHLERALREHLTAEKRAALLAELGEARWLSGSDPEAAVTHLREAVDVLRDPALLAHATLVLARALFHGGRAQQSAEALLHVLDTRPDLSRADNLRLEAELGSMGLLTPSSMPHLRERLASFGDLSGETTEELLMLGTVAGLLWQRGSAADLAEGARRALAGGRLLAAVGSDNFAFLMTLAALIGADELDEARTTSQAALADARTRGSMFGFVIGSLMMAGVELRAGDVRELEAHARGGLEVPGSTEVLRPALQAHLALAFIERDELDEAEAALDQDDFGPYVPVASNRNFSFFARGQLRAAQGRDEEALEDLREFGDREAAGMVGNPAFPWRVHAALACWRLGQDEQADALLSQHEEVAERWGTPAALAVGMQGRAAAPNAAPDERMVLLEGARSLLSRSPYRLAEAAAVRDLGVAMRRAGRRRDAQRHLSEAVALAGRCGATALASSANDELGVLTQRPRRLQFSGVDSLTASERRVALMAAEGESNPQIAQALFVTPKTVENHLGRVYIKLAISSRSELPHALRVEDA